MNDKVKVFLAKYKKPKFLIGIGLIGIILIGLSSVFSGEKKETKLNKDSFDIEEYRVSLEKSIISVVNDITGDKKATVLVTLENGVRYSYADDVKTDTDLTDGEKTKQSRKSSESFHITVKDSSGDEKALIVTENMPQVRGVAIICENGDDEYVREKIESAVIAALDITSKRVYITGRN